VSLEKDIRNVHYISRTS